MSPTSKPSELEMHRIKNRECMRKARLRQRQQLQEMKRTVHKLEKQYADLSHRASTTTHVHEGQQREYTEAVAVAKRLGAENLLLQSILKQKSAWKRKLQCILDFEESDVAPPSPLQNVFNLRIDMLDEAQAAEELGFLPLTELDFDQVTLDNNRDIHNVVTRLLHPSTLENCSYTHRMQAFDWDIVQRVENNVMEFVFTKNFYGLNVLELMQRTWVNSLQLDEFKKIKAEIRRLQVLQQINQTAMVFVCDVGSPSDIPTFRSVFTRFLVESTTPGTLSDGLTGTGYVLGTQSVSTNYPLQLSERKSCENVTWAHLALSIEALEVFNSTTGENYQRIRWVGRTDYGSKEHAQRDAADTLQSMLRWEMLLVAPALNLP